MQRDYDPLRLEHVFQFRIPATFELDFRNKMEAEYKMNEKMGVMMRGALCVSSKQLRATQKKRWAAFRRDKPRGST